jgi:uncharacterized protein YbcC (UPF0753/DUF2309 family)
MVVAQWINSQYLFSTLDNIAFGSGSKVTQNIVGKIGVMQGNGSDLMHGMSLQSSFTSDRKNYHEAMRLHCLVHAPKERISDVIKNNEILQKLFGNCWVHLFCLNPENNKIYQLDEGFVWKSCEVKINEKLWKYL